MSDALSHLAPPADTLTSWWEGPTDEIEGHDLVKEDALFALVGVPFMLTGATFHDGVKAKGAKWQSDYVSLELRVAPAEWIAQRVSAGRLSTDAAAKVQPGEMLVINDGSTGIYRQIVQYLAAKELITLPEGPEEGEKGETIWDLPRSQWLTGAEEGTKGFSIALRCGRGLRFSEYNNPVKPDEKARTWYLA